MGWDREQSETAKEELYQNVWLMSMVAKRKDRGG